MSYSFLDLAYDVLEDSRTPLTYQQIWDNAKQSGLASKIESTGKTPWQSLGARLYVEVRDNASSKIVKVSSRPARCRSRLAARRGSEELARLLSRGDGLALRLFVGVRW
jgi:hypothetical protein